MSFNFEVVVIVILALRIELGPARAAAVVRIQILPDRHLRLAGAAQNCLLVPFCGRPDFNRMARQFVVTILAGVVLPATLHPDRDDVSRPVIVGATRLRIEIDAAYQCPSTNAQLKWSAVLRRSRQSGGRDRRNGFRKSSAAFCPGHQASSCGSDSSDGRTT